MVENEVEKRRKTAIVTSASRGIGAGVTQAFLERSYNVVASLLRIEDSELETSDRLGLVQGDIGEAATAAKIADTAMSHFGSIHSRLRSRWPESRCRG